MQNVQQLVNTIKYSGNPEKMLANNPQLQEVLKMVNGKNPEQVFYEKCNEMGINPDMILGMLR